MVEVKLNKIIDCVGISSDEINKQIRELIFNNCKHLILQNPNEINNLLSDIKGNIKVEIMGNVGNNFVNNVQGLKIILNGNIGDDSALNFINSKLTVFGSCGSFFGKNAQNSEFYIFENCASGAFQNLTDFSKVVIGGQAGGSFVSGVNNTTIVVLNLKGGKLFIEDGNFKDVKESFIYYRGDCKSNTDRFSLENTNEKDEDIHLPLISEFARLFNYSLSEIKSRQFYKLIIK